jgi:hypothetical protein
VGLRDENVSIFVAIAAGSQENKPMRTIRAQAAEAAFAQPLSEELLTCSGIAPGMRALVLGGALADIALLVAERVGPTGGVLGIHRDSKLVAEARRRARDESFDGVEFRSGSLDRIELEAPVDAVIGRFFLMHEPDPVTAVRLAAAKVRDGGRIVFHEWHYESVGWAATSAWPQIALYHRFAHLSVEGLRVRGAHVDMGLRLANVFSEAGLSPPGLRSDLRVVNGPDSLGYAFFETTLRKLLPTIERSGLAVAADIDVDTFAKRLERETTAAGGHLFLPLQIGAWTRNDRT